MTIIAKACFGFGDVNGCIILKNILLKFKKMNKEETLEQLKEIIKPYTNNQRLLITLQLTQTLLQI
jgi:hypothetical protein